MIPKNVPYNHVIIGILENKKNLQNAYNAMKLVTANYEFSTFL